MADDVQVKGVKAARRPPAPRVATPAPVRRDPARAAEKPGRPGPSVAADLSVPAQASAPVRASAPVPASAPAPLAPPVESLAPLPEPTLLPPESDLPVQGGPAAPTASALSSLFPRLLEKFTVTTPSFDFAAAFKTAYSDAQEKAKEAYAKGSVAVSDANEFAKGNVEALVESTKILASGLQELTTELVAESRDAFETLTAEAKTLAAAKSPADFFKLQSDILRKQLDVLLANGTKHSEAFLKLASDAAAPLSSRVTLAVEKVKAAA